MGTTTARYGFFKPALTDNVDIVADFNNNYDAIDLKLGSQVCTSSTRPASPIEGMQIFESDTGATRTYSGSAWLPAEIMVATSSSMPSNPITGDLVYITNHPSIALWNGTAWMYQTVAIVTSTTRPISFIANGTMIYETDTNRFLAYNGTTWVNKAYSNFVCTSSTHPATPFQGLEIYETDTSMNAVYSGSNYLYGLQQLAPTQILGATTASVTFSSIPAVTRLQLVARFRYSTTGAVDVMMQLDGNTGSNYLWTKLESNATVVSGTRSGALTTSAKLGVLSGTNASNFGSGQYTIDGWANATGFCTWTGTYANYDSATADWAATIAGMFAVVGPHNAVKIFPSANSFAAGSQFSIYGSM